MKPYKRGDVWWIDYYVDGTRHRESSKSTRLRDAKGLLSQRLAEAGAGEFVRPATRRSTLFVDLLDDLEPYYERKRRKSIKRLRVTVAHLRRHFPRIRANALNEDRIDRYIIDRRNEGASDSSIQKELSGACPKISWN